MAEVACGNGRAKPFLNQIYVADQTLWVREKPYSIPLTAVWSGRLAFRDPI